MSEPKERIHYARAPFELRQDFDYREVQIAYKPGGLWYSAPYDSDGWEDWCRGEGFRLEALRAQHRVELDAKRILMIRDVGALDMFHHTYEMPWERTPLGSSGLASLRDLDRFIDWARVARDYAGVEIAPYQWSRRNTYMWYYGWDCASGVIWDLSAVTGFEALPQSQIQQERFTALSGDL